MTPPRTIEIDKLIALRDHHVREAQRIDDALSLLRDVDRMSRKAAKTIGQVRARAAENNPTPKKPKGPTAAKYAQQKAARESGSRPIDRLRAVLSQTSESIERDVLIARAGLEKHDPVRLGVVFGGLTSRKEIRVHADGTIRALAGLRVSEPSNGAHP